MEPISLLAGLLIGALATAAAVAILTWLDVNNWFMQNTNSNYSLGMTIKEMISDGRYGICTGVFTSSGDIGSINGWKTDKLDTSVSSKFNNSNIIIESYR